MEVQRESSGIPKMFRKGLIQEIALLLSLEKGGSSLHVGGGSIEEVSEILGRGSRLKKDTEVIKHIRVFS